MAQLSPEDRALLAGHLNRTRDLVRNAVANLRPDQWVFRPDDLTWSIGECAGHIASVENRAFALVSSQMRSIEPNPQRAAEVQRKTELMLRAIPSRESRVKAPHGGNQHTQFDSPRQFLDSFEEQRAQLAKYIAETEDALHDRVAPHPFFKDLDGCQWLLMIPLHTERHAAQIEEVKGHPRYPK